MKKPAKNKKMTAQEQGRLYRICYDSKAGRGLSSLADQKFIMDMFEKYQDEYVEIHGKAAKQAVEDATPKA
jgi:hypothetical protein